jgi:hypothetical protein
MKPAHKTSIQPIKQQSTDKWNESKYIYIYIYKTKQTTTFMYWVFVYAYNQTIIDRNSQKTWEREGI